MDILRILSRGTKPNPKNQPAKGSAAAAAAATAKLPSAGAAPHPQLFNDPVSASSRGKKRKRKNKGGDQDGQDDDDDGQANKEDEDLSDVDFFAPPKPKTETVQQQHAEADGEGQKRKNKKRKVKTLDEDECKQILRSHRLKFTLLSESVASVAELEAQAEEGKKSKRKRSKKAEEKESKEEEEKKKKKEKDAKKSKLAQLWPQPLTAFGQLKYDYGIDQTLADNITRQGFKVPTEVQMGALPLLLQPGTALGDKEMEKGVDFLAVAPTGSGKTITFLIPAIEGVLKARGGVKEGEEVKNELRAIVVAPTRELASQIVNEGRKLAIGTGVRVVLMKRGLRLQAEGGAEKAEVEEDSDSEDDEEKPEEEEQDQDEDEEDKEDSDEEDGDDKKKDQKEKPLARVDILVTTPKILLNFLSDDGKLTNSKKTLPTVRSLILDEADVLLDPIFRKQTMAIWKSCIHPDVALTCWSATMASNIEALVTKHLSKRAKHFNVSRPLVRLVVGLKDTAVPNVTHKLIYTATEQGKLLALRQLLHPASSSDSGPPLRPPFIVFTQTIDRAKALHKELQFDIPLEAGGQARIAVLHSSLSDQVRAKIMTKFRSGEVWVLITTDVLARGVDFAGVNGVVNYDVPTSAAGYVHRAGRTGRAGREGGVAVTFYTKEDIPFVKSVANVIAASEKQAGKAGSGEESVKQWLLDALPKVAKEDKRKLKVRGVEARRAGGKEASITTQSSWERRRENNKRQAIEASKKRKKLALQAEKQGGGGQKKDDGEEWGGLDD
ncbi:putative ATP-dependent RNA helicase [Cercophora samala]|uniref:ATP-dependent RNA helicase n=1 Tax=Cercophora samala TaxID=330535 RepID=A0AA40D1Y4_9PEZI|nr:putative ATP-dependent RNA helicase [Cercophora samala]